MKKICNIIRNRIKCCAKRAYNLFRKFANAVAKAFFEFLETGL